MYGTLSSTSQMACTIPRIMATLAVLFPDVAMTGPVVSVWPHLPRWKSLLVMETALFDEDAEICTSVFEDSKASDNWLPDESFWPFRRKILMLVVVSSQVLMRGRSGSCDIQQILHCR